MSKQVTMTASEQLGHMLYWYMIAFIAGGIVTALVSGCP